MILKFTDAYDCYLTIAEIVEFSYDSDDEEIFFRTTDGDTYAFKRPGNAGLYLSGAYQRVVDTLFATSKADLSRYRATLKKGKVSVPAGSSGWDKCLIRGEPYF